MMMRIICVIILIAYGAVSSVRAQDIEPQYIPRPPKTEAPVTTTEISGNNPTTTEDVEETSTSTEPVVDTQTEPITGTPVTYAPETTTEAKETTTDINTTTDIVTTTDLFTTTSADEDTTTSAPPIATIPEEVTNAPTIATVPEEATIAPTKASIPEGVTTPTPGRRRKGSGSPVVCKLFLQNGKPYFNWFYRVVVVPKTCFYCCRYFCNNGPEHCTPVSPFFCNR